MVLVDSVEGKSITGNETSQKYYNLSNDILEGAIGESLETWSVIS